MTDGEVETQDEVGDVIGTAERLASGEDVVEPITRLEKFRINNAIRIHV